jgi:hypothetical protein
MAMIDERGRLFGRVNVVDAIVAVLVLALIPLGYASYLLFRTPFPVLTRVEPTTLTYGTNMRIKVHGENFKPYLRVSLGIHQGRNFLFHNSTEAGVELFDVPPGVYDVILFDQAQERGRLKNAITIAPSALPDAQVVVVGMFGNLKPDQVGRITAGMTIDGVGTVVAVGRPVPQMTRVFVRPGTFEVPAPNAQMVPAVVRMGCYVRSNQGQPECVAASLSVQPAALMFLETPAGTVPFQIDQVRGLGPIEPVQVTVEFSGAPSVLAQIAPGDRDVGDVSNELSATGTVTAVSGSGGTRVARLTLDAQRGSAGWLYAMAPLRLGTSFVLRNPKYEAQGRVTALSPPFESPRP